MKVPISWLKDFVDLDGMSVVEVAHVLTMGGLEVEDIRFVGLPMPADHSAGFKFNGISWAPEKLVVAEVHEVNAHPNADRLTLCSLYDGEQEHIVLTGAPNLYPYKGIGRLEQPIKVAYAREGAVIYDGHVEEPSLTTLKRARIRGVDSYSMICSEKELGISDDHEGVIFLDSDAPTGMALADYMGDAVLEVKINPNMARNTSILGIAREVAALSNRNLRKPEYKLETSGEQLAGKVSLRIQNPQLNPRFTLGLIRGVEIRESPYWYQRRLRLAGMRPISNVVDATNYTMIEIGTPLHAFDYAVLQKRAGGVPVVISTRTAEEGEVLQTLDGSARKLTTNNVLVCDEAGPLSLAGVMGGLESEITGQTQDILLEAAAWNFINIRRTANQHGLPSEASYRFSRGVHPALCEQGLRRCLYWMAVLCGGDVAPDIVDSYPLPPLDPRVDLTERDIRRTLGVEIPLEKAQALLERLEFGTKLADGVLQVQTPPFRMDIGEGLVGVADIMEELARLVGYDNIPETLMADPLPPQRGNPGLEKEEQVRNLMAEMGLQEVITHRMTAPEAENRLLAGWQGATPEQDYVRLINPIAPEKRVMRRSLLASTFSVLERNVRLSPSLALFEVGPVFLPSEGQYPHEPLRLAIALSGIRQPLDWLQKEEEPYTFFDLKGMVEELFHSLHITVRYEACQHASFHPGKCARVLAEDETDLGIFGEMHPQALKQADFPQGVVAAELNLTAILERMPLRGYPVQAISEFPPVLEDLAVVVDEAVSAERVEQVIRQAGGRLLAGLRLFDIFRGERVGAGKKSMAYALTYQSLEKTLSDKDATAIRQKIIRRLEQELGAKLRS